MITPTFFDITTITGLPPTGETFNPYLNSDNTIDFTVKNTSFSAYINYYHVDAEDVSDVKHIALLALWISKFVF